MSKLQALDSLKQQHKKIERLYFPKYGDPSLYNNCGRKHYAQSSIFSLPYQHQVYFRNQQYLDFLHKKLNFEHKFQPKNEQQPKTQQVNYSIYDQETHKPNDFVVKQPLNYRIPKTYADQLDNYHNFNLSSLRNQRLKNGHSRERQFPLYNRVKEQPMRASRYQKNKIRAKTQAECQSTQGRVESTGNGKRIKTELNQPGQIRNLLKTPRFNPTFLSSINY